jgi:hypothetical protein
MTYAENQKQRARVWDWSNPTPWYIKKLEQQRKRINWLKRRIKVLCNQI